MLEKLMLKRNNLLAELKDTLELIEDIQGYVSNSPTSDLIDKLQQFDSDRLDSELKTYGFDKAKEDNENYIYAVMLNLYDTLGKHQVLLEFGIDNSYDFIKYVNDNSFDMIYNLTEMLKEGL